MITVEIRRPVGMEDWDVLSTIRVDDDNEVHITGAQDPELVRGIRVVAEGRAVTAADDPQLWARNLPTAFRTGQLEAHLVEDAE